VLGEEPRAYLERLSPEGSAAGVGLYHGSPRDPVWEYVLSEPAALAALEATEAPIVLVGHSHVALAISLARGELAGGLAREGHEADLSAGRWLLNPGSVGQPRDGDPRAAWLELDLGNRRARFRRVAYPVERTQAEIRERGLPDALADRLAHGV
jgi:diadenosine tetraphosphatase ApaH/serine/threonine PP2A family protein phosphatase